MNAKDGFLGLIVLLLTANLAATLWANLGEDEEGQDSAVAALAVPLPKIVSAELKEDLLEEFIDCFNGGDFDDLYAMLGPAAQAHVSEEAVESLFEKLSELFDSIEEGAFSHSLLVATQGNTRIYQLYYELKLSEDSEFGEQGTLQITLAIEGDDYQVYDLALQAGAYSKA